MNNGFIKVAVGTPDIKVADCQYNASRIIDLIGKAIQKKVSLLVFPELSVTGCTCGDLFRQQVLHTGAVRALDSIVDATRSSELIVLVGLPLLWKGKLYNCTAVLFSGEILGVIPKTHLTSSEARWFDPAPMEGDSIRLKGTDIPFGTDILFCSQEMNGFKFAVEIGEDLNATFPPSVDHACAGATVIANLSAGNDVAGSQVIRRNIVVGQSARLSSAYLYANAGFGESSTDLVFCAHNLIAEAGDLLGDAAMQENHLLISEIDVERLVTERAMRSSFPAQEFDYREVQFSQKIKQTELTRRVSVLPFLPEHVAQYPEYCDTVLTLQALGLKKRLKHTRQEQVILGLSGGLDSTLALLVAVKAFSLMNLPIEGIHAVSMPGFGTTARTKNNASKLADALGISFSVIPIGKAVKQHFSDIGHDAQIHDAVFENAQARERTQILMDLGNKLNALVLGTGDLSELALGWATYNGDHMSMYGLNASVPKTLVRHVVSRIADTTENSKVAKILKDILATPISPELLPTKEGEIGQKTEDIIGPYELHDFFLFYVLSRGYGPKKVFCLAEYAFRDQYKGATIKSWLTVFYRRFLSQQFKRSCMPDGPKVTSVSLSPRGSWVMPSDASAELWLEELENI